MIRIQKKKKIVFRNMFIKQTSSLRHYKKVPSFLCLLPTSVCFSVCHPGLTINVLMIFDFCPLVVKHWVTGATASLYADFQLLKIFGYSSINSPSLQHFLSGYCTIFH
jgi:hypothetical protein